MSFANEILTLGLIPLAVAAAVTFLVRWSSGKPPVAWAVGVGLAFVSGHMALAGRHNLGRALRTLLEPSEGRDWLPHAVLLAMGVTLLAAYAPRSWRGWNLAFAAALSLAVPLRLLAGHLAQQWSILEKFLHLALLSATFALVWLLLAAAREEAFPRVRQMLVVLVALAAAWIATLSGSFTLGRMCGVLAAGIVGAALVSPRGLEGAAGVVTFSFGGLIILGVFYASLHPVNAALLFASLVAAAGRLPDFVEGWPAWQPAVIRALLSLIPLAIALANSFK